MKKVLIIGASGSLAPYVIQAVRKLADTSLTLFVRDKNKLSQVSQANDNVIEGDATNYQDVRKAVSGQDIVYVNLAGNLESMAKNITTAMQEAQVKRVIAISSIGIYETPLKPILKPYRRLADIIEDSGLDYTILRPDWFTNDDEVDYALTEKGQPETGMAISRKSIATFVAHLIENPQLHVRENLGISKPTKQP